MSKDEPQATVYYLEMKEPEALCPADAPPGLEASVIDPPSPEANRHFYETVGGAWLWTECLVWSDDDWADYARRPEMQTWIGRFQGQRIGYFELERQAHGSVEIVHFGLLPESIGCGLGGPFLTKAIEQAWQIPGTRRVWLHTCSNDHPHAFSNYRARGFSLFRTESASRHDSA